MRALGVLLVLVGCSSSPPTPDASIEDAASEASNDAATETSTSPDGGCTSGMCSDPDGGVYKSVPFDCTNGCGFPLTSAAVTACGL